MTRAEIDRQIEGLEGMIEKKEAKVQLMLGSLDHMKSGLEKLRAMEPDDQPEVESEETVDEEPVDEEPVDEDVDEDDGGDEDAQTESDTEEDSEDS